MDKFGEDSVQEHQLCFAVLPLVQTAVENESAPENVNSDVAATVVEDCNVSSTEEEKSYVPTNEDMIHNQSCQIDLDDVDKISLNNWLEEHLVLVKDIRSNFQKMVEVSNVNLDSRFDMHQCVLAEAEEVVENMHLHVLTKSEKVLDDKHLKILADVRGVR